MYAGRTISRRHHRRSDAGRVSYQTALGGWHDFYVVAGTASATLVGLLFVGLSLHLRIVVASSDVRSLARVTLTNFATVLFVALFMVIPQNQSAAAFQLVGTGLVSLLVNTPSLVAAAARPVKPAAKKTAAKKPAAKKTAAKRKK